MVKMQQQLASWWRETPTATGVQQTVCREWNLPMENHDLQHLPALWQIVVGMQAMNLTSSVWENEVTVELCVHLLVPLGN
mmetsp:Transcript_51977/g.151008  ORF Transcript_51977/g.151008 Transcript_51977/m.151008 type:complete len:80 (+) Transcript_51977:625-864(+)